MKTILLMKKKTASNPEICLQGTNTFKKKKMKNKLYKKISFV
jgi:hypothetical protein